MSVGTVTIDFKAELARLETDLGRAVHLASKETRRLGRAVNAQLSKLNRQARDQFRKLRSAAVGALGGISVAALGVGFAQTSDLVDNLDARLRLATRTQTEFVEVQKALQVAAQDSFAPIETLTGLYARIERAVRGYGFSQAEILEITEATTRAFAISGATQQEQSAAIIQLGQAFSAAALQGEEFRSINEQAARIIEGLIRTMGIGRDELKQFSKEGRIGITELRQALSGDEADRIAKEFEEIPVTFGRAITLIKNNTALLVGEFNKQTKAAQILREQGLLVVSDGLKDLAEDLEQLASSGGLEAVGAIINVVIPLLDDFIILLGAAGVAKASRAAFIGISTLTAFMRTTGGNVIKGQITLWSAFNTVLKGNALILGTLGLFAVVEGFIALSSAQSEAIEQLRQVSEAANEASEALVKLDRDPDLTKEEKLTASLKLQAALAEELSKSIEKARQERDKLNSRVKVSSEFLSSRFGDSEASQIPTGAVTSEALNQSVTKTKKLFDQATDTVARIRGELEGLSTIQIEAARTSKRLSEEANEISLGFKGLAAGDLQKVVDLFSAYSRQVEESTSSTQPFTAETKRLLERTKTGIKTLERRKVELLEGAKAADTFALSQQKMRAATDRERSAIQQSIDTIRALGLEIENLERKRALETKTLRENSDALKEGQEFLEKLEGLSKKDPLASLTPGQETAKRIRELTETFESLPPELQKSSANVELLRSAIRALVSDLEDEHIANAEKLEDFQRVFTAIDEEIKAHKEGEAALRELNLKRRVENELLQMRAIFFQATGRPLNNEEIQQLKEKLRLLAEINQEFSLDLSFSKALGKSLETGDIRDFFKVFADELDKATKKGLTGFAEIASELESALSVLNDLGIDLFNSDSQSARKGGRIGGAAGSIGGAIAGNSAAGKAIGKFIGSILGGIFGKSPRVRIGGDESGIKVDDKTDTRIITALGPVLISLRKLKVEDLQRITSEITNLDDAISKAIGPQRSKQAEEALRNFFASEKGKNLSVEEIYTERLNAVLSAIEPEVKALVDGVGSDINDRIRRLSEVVSIQDAFVSGNDLLGSSDSLSSLVNILDDLSKENETLVDTYNRLIRNGQSYRDVLEQLEVNTDLAGESLIRFADDISNALGRDVSEVIPSIISALDPEGSVLRQANRLEKSARDAFAKLGVTLEDVLGTDIENLIASIVGSSENTPEIIAEWLTALEVLSDYTEAEKALNASRSESVQAQKEALSANLEAAQALKTFKNLIEFRAESFSSLIDLRDIVSDLGAEASNAVDSLREALLFFGDDDTLSTILKQEKESLDKAFSEFGIDDTSREGFARALKDALSSADSAEDVNKLLELADQLADYYKELEDLESRRQEAVEDRLENEKELAEAEEAKNDNLKRTLQEFLDTSDLSDFTSPFKEQYAQLLASRDAAIEAAKALGSNEEELRRIREVSSARIALLTRQLISSIRDLADIINANNGNLRQVSDTVETISSAARLVRSAWEDAIKRIQDQIDDLKLSGDSPLTPTERFEFARAEFERLLALAESGDIDAANSLPEALRQFITEANTVFGGAGDFPSIFADAISRAGALTAGNESTDPAPTRSQVQSIQDSSRNTEEDISQLVPAVLQLLDQARLLSSISGDSPLQIISGFGVELGRVFEILGINISEPTIQTASALADLTEILGVSLSDLQQAIDLNLGILTDATSLLNDALEAAILSLPPEIREPLLDALREAERTGSTEKLEDLIEDLPVAERNLLAPFFDTIDATEFHVETNLLLGRIADSNARVIDELRQIREALDREATDSVEASSQTSGVDKQLGALISLTRPETKVRAFDLGQTVAPKTEPVFIEDMFSDRHSTGNVNKGLTDFARPNRNVKKGNSCG